MRCDVPFLRPILPRDGGLRTSPCWKRKLREAIVGELERQAADRPQALKVQGTRDANRSEELTVNGRIDLAALVMVIAGSVAGGP